ncbi:MAG: twin-arginine translocase TatA/TatE family subunit [Bacteroidales bacterium]|nr:twin-arginine translocase TatA/TatE family subunit [Bacteroidales bacterium]
MNTYLVPLFFNVSGAEILIILLVLIIVFGPKKIPEIARQLGKGINEMKKASSDIAREFRKEADDIERDVRKEVSQIKQDVEKAVDPDAQKHVRSSQPAEIQEIPEVYQQNDIEPEKNKISSRQPIL